MALRRRLLGALLVMATAGTSACSAAEPQFAGFVTLVERGSGTGGARIMVESHAHKMVQRHVLIVTPQTVIVKREGDMEKTVTLDSLAAKNWVKVWFTGGEKSAYPLEVTAQRILILDRL